MRETEICIKIPVYKRQQYSKGGGEPIQGTVLFGKYRVIRVLGYGRDSTVYLAWHQELEEYRAVKRVSRASGDAGQFKKEALLLKRLSHPAIPRVYDLEEDPEYYYLIEEFLEGSSFCDLVEERGHLSQEAVIRCGIQICSLVHYLHSAEEVPILYLDLQPRNLLLCHGQVKLLDFNHAAPLREANASPFRYGTPGYCAPEQMGKGALGVFTDVYQIGKVLAFLLTGSAGEDSLRRIPGSLGRLIRTCTCTDSLSRLPSADAVRQELEDIGKKAGLEVLGERPLIAAFAAWRPGAGATHLAIGLCACLNHRGIPCLYEERNESGDAWAMAGQLKAEADSYGICTLSGIPVRPRYGQAVRLKPHGFPAVVRDYGTHVREAAQDGAADLFVLVYGGRWWDWRPEGLDPRPLAMKKLVLCREAVNAGSGRIRRPEGTQHWRWYRVPEFSDPFLPDRKARELYRLLWQEMPGTGKQIPAKERGGSLWDFFGNLRQQKSDRGSSA